MNTSSREEFLKNVADLYIYSFVVKLKKINGSIDKIKIIRPPEVFDDDNLPRQRRHGIYGWCEVETEDTANSGHGQDYGSAIEWKMRYCELPPSEVCKFAGVVQYRLREVLAGRVPFNLTEQQAEELSKKINPEEELETNHV